MLETYFKIFFPHSKLYDLGVISLVYLNVLNLTCK